MRRYRKAPTRLFCRSRMNANEEKTKMFLNYELQYELVNQHRQELEAQAAQSRLIACMEKPKARTWNFITWLSPRVIGAEVAPNESCQALAAR